MEVCLVESVGLILALKWQEYKHCGLVKLMSGVMKSLKKDFLMLHSIKTLKILENIIYNLLILLVGDFPVKILVKHGRDQG